MHKVAESSTEKRFPRVAVGGTASATAGTVKEQGYSSMRKHAVSVTGTLHNQSVIFSDIRAGYLEQRPLKIFSQQKNHSLHNERLNPLCFGIEPLMLTYLNLYHDQEFNCLNLSASAAFFSLLK